MDMKTIVQHYGADLDWIESFSENFEGKVNGNFINIPDSIHTGDKYFLKCGEGIVALYADIIYHIDFRLIHKNFTNDFVGLYYNLSEGEVRMTYEENCFNVGPWAYNLFLIDSSLEYQYDVVAGSKCFVLVIFIKKETIKEYLERNSFFGEKINDLFNPVMNTLIKWDRMSNESFYMLSELRKNEVGKGVFDLNLIATVHLLLSEYLIKLSNNNNELVIQVVDESDLSGIMQVQQFLIENISCPYPGNKVIAERVNMSESKFKPLFKKVTGISPNAFFIDNKLNKAKELLETKEWSVSDVTFQLGFFNSSHFSFQFKKKFGINPKQFIQQL